MCTVLVGIDEYDGGGGACEGEDITGCLMGVKADSNCLTGTVSTDDTDAFPTHVGHVSPTNCFCHLTLHRGQMKKGSSLAELVEGDDLSISELCVSELLGSSSSNL